MSALQVFFDWLSTGWQGNVTAGLVSGLFVSIVFYWLSGRGLRNEAKRLRHLTTLIIRGLEEAGVAKFTRGASGEPIGLIFERNPVSGMGMKSEVRVEADVR